MKLIKIKNIFRSILNNNYYSKFLNFIQRFIYIFEDLSDDYCFTEQINNENMKIIF